MHQDLPTDATRTAFTLGVVQTRRDTARITAIAVDAKLHRLFLGLSTGYVEEHQLLLAGGGAVGPYNTAPTAPGVAAAGGSSAVVGTRLLSGRKLFKQGVAELCSLPVAQRVVARSPEGGVVVCPYESAEVFPVSVLKNTIALAGHGLVKAPARLAAACKSGALPVSGAAKSTKLLVCLVGGGPGGTTSNPAQQVQVLAQLQVEEPVLALTWAGDAVLLALPHCYRIIASGGVATDVAPHSCPQPAVAAVPPSQEAMVLLSETMVVVVNAQGVAVSAPLFLSSFPLALACTGSQVLVITDEGVEVHDKIAGSWLQTIPFVHDDAYVQAARRLPCCQDWNLGNVLFATSTTLFCLSPVSAEAQVHELLKKRKYAAAMSLVSSHASPTLQPAPTTRPTSMSGSAFAAAPPSATAAPASSIPAWCANATAQAALLLLQEARFLPALALLLQLPTSCWQPCQLLHLFPTFAARWLHEVPQQTYWCLHGALTDLKRMVQDHVELQHATQHHPPSSQSSPSHTGVTHYSSMTEDSAVQLLLLEAKVHIAAYLMQARSLPGVQLRGALDTLLLHLLLECGLVGQLEALVCRHDFDAVLRDAVSMLSSNTRWHALALLRVARNHTQEALEIWDSLGRSTLTEDASCMASDSHSASVASQGSSTAALQDVFGVLEQLAPKQAWLQTVLVDSINMLEMPTSATDARSQPEQQQQQQHLQALVHAPEVFERATNASVTLRKQLAANNGTVPLAGHTAVDTAASSIGTNGHTGVSQDAVLGGLEAAKGSQPALAAAAMAALMSHHMHLAPENQSLTSAMDHQASRTTSTGGLQAQLSQRTSSVGGFQTVLSGEHSNGAVRSSSHASQLNASAPATQQASGSRNQLVQVRRMRSGSPGVGQPAASQQPGYHVAVQLMSWAQSWTDIASSNVTLPVMAVPMDPVAPELVLSKLPWLLSTFPGEALQVLVSRPDLPLTQVLALLHDCTNDVRWRYLHHLLYPGTSHNSSTMHSSSAGLRARTLSPIPPTLPAPATPTNQADGSIMPLTLPDLTPLHTELGLEIVECIGRDLQGASQGGEVRQQEEVAASAGGEPAAHAPQEDDHVVAGTQRPPSGAVSGEAGARWGQLLSGSGTLLSAQLQLQHPQQSPSTRLEWLCRVLDHHLVHSKQYDPAIVLQAVQATCAGSLLREEVHLYSRIGDHVAALRILVVQLQDVDAGIAYCKQRQAEMQHPASHSEQRQAAATLQLPGSIQRGSGPNAEVVERLWLALLEICLQPGDGMAPMYSAALRVLAAPSLSNGLSGGIPHLDPLKVLAALPDEMPVDLASNTLASMIISTTHRHRNAQVLKSLYRAQNLELKAQMLDGSQQRVVVNDATSCRQCHRILAGRVFVRTPSGALLCDRCARVITQE